MINAVGFDMTKTAAQRLFDKAGYKAEQVRKTCKQKSKIVLSKVDVVELHDCFSCNELLTYEALGLCAEGEGGKMVICNLLESNLINISKVDNGDNTYGGKYVVNPSGGLISKGHPLGATGYIT